MAVLGETYAEFVEGAEVGVDLEGGLHHVEDGLEGDVEGGVQFVGDLFEATSALFEFFCELGSSFRPTAEVVEELVARIL